MTELESRKHPPILPLVVLSHRQVIIRLLWCGRRDRRLVARAAPDVTAVSWLEVKVVTSQLLFLHHLEHPVITKTSLRLHGSRVVSSIHKLALMGIGDTFYCSESEQTPC